MDIDTIIGLLVSLLGLIMVIYLFINPSEKDDNESLKSANFQFMVLGIALIIIGLIIAF